MSPSAGGQAFELIGQELRSLDSPNEAVFSGRASNEAVFLYGLFARQFGTNNLPDCSNMCHESSGTGLSEVIGFGKATVRIEDFALADSIFVIGQNPGTCHPRMLTELHWKEFNFSPPEKHGLDAVCAIENMHQGAIEAFLPWVGTSLFYARYQLHF